MRTTLRLIILLVGRSTHAAVVLVVVRVLVRKRLQRFFRLTALILLMLSLSTLAFR